MTILEGIGYGGCILLALGVCYLVALFPLSACMLSSKISREEEDREC